MSLDTPKSPNTKYDLVVLSRIDKDGNISLLHNKPLYLDLLNQVPDSTISFYEDRKVSLFKYTISSKEFEFAKLGAKKLIVNTNTDSICLQFSKDNDKNDFIEKLTEIKFGKKASIFDQRTDETSAMQYFQFYSLLSQQQNMMQDYIRTATYQRAILDNYADFEGKVVLDVGAGSGILSFFAVQAGAKQVYAVEASSIAQHANTLVKHNNMQNKIKVIAGKIEEIELPEKVDIIISEPMGYMLLNERMLESYLHAKKWLKPSGKMFPSQGDIFVAPFTDETLYMEQVSKANFWSQNCFYGVDLTVLRSVAYEEYFKQPVVDTFDSRIIIALPVKHSLDFLTSHESDLYDIVIPLKYDIHAASIVHGLAFWFDVAFTGSITQTWLSTAPTQPLTHWYQVRCLFPQPFLVTRTAQLIGKVELKANKKQSYDVSIMLTVDGSTQVFQNVLDLKNPYFRYNGQVSVPAGTFHESPTEAYLNQLNGATNTNNGMLNTNGNGHSNGNGHDVKLNMKDGVSLKNGNHSHNGNGHHHQQHVKKN